MSSIRRRAEVLATSAPPMIRAGVWLGWLLLSACVATASLPLTTVQPPTSIASWCRSLLPQGWGFFTRDAEEPVLRLYAPAGDRWRRCDRPLASPGNWFGLRRDHRLRDAEVARLLAQVPESLWVPCRDEAGRCWPPGRPPAVVVSTDVRRPTVTGDLLLQVQERLPWAWGAARNRVEMPSRVVRIRVVEEDGDAS